MSKFSMFFIISILTTNIFSKEVITNPNDYKWISDNEYSFQKQTAKDRASRKFASNSEITDDLMSKDYKAFRNKFLSIKSPEELELYLSELDTNYIKYADDLKFTIALITPIRVMKSFAFRVYPLATKEKITHSAILTQILSFASFMKINLPTDQWIAGFRYVTEPINKISETEKIKSVSELQNFIGEQVYPALLKAANRISSIKINDRMILDNKLLYGTASFSDNFKRYKTFGEAERFAVLSSLHSSLSQAARFQAYNVTDLIPFMKEIASLYGYDSALFSEVDGVTAKKVQSILMKSKYKNLFTLRENGNKNMGVSLKHMKESIRLGLISWTETRDRRADESDLMNSELFTSIATRVDKNVEVVEKVISGTATLRSDITGELIYVNFPSLYLNPIKDLKILAPIGFEEGTKHLEKTIENEKYKYRNYFYGRAVSWNLEAYKSIFPDIKKGESVSTYVKILNQTTGADLLSTVINAAILY